MTRNFPIHPGEIILHDCLPHAGLSIAEGAAVLGVDAEDLTAVVEGRAPVTEDLAVALEREMGSTAETWLRIQARYDKVYGEGAADDRAVAD